MSLLDVLCGRDEKEVLTRQSRPTRNSEPPKLDGTIRVWTSLAAHNREKPTIPNTYRLGDGETIGVNHNPVHCDVGFGYCEGRYGTPNYHEWHSFSPERGVPAWAIQKAVQQELNRKYMREYTRQIFHPSPELAPYFDEKGNFIGDDPNMTFQINPKADQISKWQLAEGGFH